jgi:glutamate 5-kinase
MATESIVVKIGTSSLTREDGRVDQAVIDAVAADAAALSARGVAVTVVTSGAITAGWAEVGEGRARPNQARTLQAVSAVGQPLLMDAWRAGFAAHGRSVGQVLLAALDFAHRGQYLHARDTIRELLEMGVVPIVNENDAVAVEEIRYGDNDRLAALVANLIAADVLVLLTDTTGLHTADPRLDPGATLIEEVRAIDRDLELVAGASSSAVGSGGMASKLVAARLATWSGVEAVIAPARADEPLVRVVDRESGHGTRFVARADRLAARKAWIAFALPSRGRVVANDGAVHAVLEGGRSLLRIGIVAVSGAFDESDAVEVVDESGALVAKGLARSASSSVDDGDSVFIHRDDLVVLREG